jgi:UDP-N-acetylglucosamine 2-epimerase (non-hydrolysing)
MSEIFFEQLGLPQPDVNLEVGSGSHAVQTAQIMIRFEQVALQHRPDLVLVYGDVNSTVAAALVSAKLHIPVGHVEAGLRSFDRTMPEEINRLLTDQIAELLFTPSQDGCQYLQHEGVEPSKIYLVGNVMIDTLLKLLPQAKTRWTSLRSRLQIEASVRELERVYGGDDKPRGSNQQVAASVGELARFALVTLHRPSNVDDPVMLGKIMQTLQEIAEAIAVIFPVHPRTRERLRSLGLTNHNSQLRLIDPLGYLDFLALQCQAVFVITDSGGIQEETTFLGVPCLTVRENTERPITVTLGTNILVGQNMERLRNEVARILDQGVGQHQIPPLWDGRTGERIADVIVGAC